MKLADLDNPVRASWLVDQGLRLDPGPYVSDAYRTYKLLDRVPHTDSLADVTERIFRPGIFRRHWTADRSHGVPFLGSATIFRSDLSTLPMITKRCFTSTPDLPLKPGWTLVTCSGMTSGRVTYARLDMGSYACGQDVIRVVPDLTKIAPGYLYTVLASNYGKPMIRGRVYGTSVKHLEPEHISTLIIPRVDADIERRIDEKVQDAMELRAQFQAGVVTATEDLFTSAGLPELVDLAWHEQPRDLGFGVPKVDARTLRALNLAPRAQRIMDTLRSVSHRTLGEICTDGQLSRGNRFKRIDSDPRNGVLLIGQRQGFWLRPEGRWIALNPSDLAMARATDEAVLVASQGTLGENEVFCRPIFVTGKWQRDFVFSEHFLRVISGDGSFPGSYLFAFLRSEAVFRILRSISVGGKQQDIHPGFREQIPVPECAPTDRERIAETVRRAYRDRDEADRKEDEALALLDDAVREAAH